MLGQLVENLLLLDGTGRRNCHGRGFGWRRRRVCEAGASDHQFLKRCDGLRSCACRPQFLYRLIFQLVGDFYPGDRIRYVLVGIAQLDLRPNETFELWHGHRALRKHKGRRDKQNKQPATTHTSILIPSLESRGLPR
jgi:hypothetical protein